VRLAAGATATVVLSCAGFDRAPPLAASSDEPPLGVGERQLAAAEVTAVLLVRATPDLDLLLFGGGQPPLGGGKARAGYANLTDGTVPRAQALPLRLKATPPHGNASALVLSPEPRGSGAAVVVAGVPEAAAVARREAVSAVLELTPRHLTLVESAGALEGWLALRLKPDAETEEPVAFTVFCPHPKVVAHPAAGLLRRRASHGGGRDEHAGGGDSTVWVRVSLPLASAGGLRCTALEVEVGPGGQRRCVPVRLPDTCLGRAATPAAAASGLPGHPASGNACATGVYFKGAMVNFGRVPAGELKDLTLRLCNPNPAGAAAAVRLDDPGAPFVLRHHVVSVRPRAYVKVPLRFAPSARGDFEVVLAARNANGHVVCQVTLVGTAV
jgi:hypothetical protein